MASTGVLVANLGTPRSPEPGPVRAYLREFLSDPRVVDLPRWLWLPLLHGIILPIRPRRTAALYRRIWSERDGAPLLHHCRELTAALAARLQEHLRPAPRVGLGMRYGEPSIEAALQELGEPERLIVLPLYPQYSATTVASTFDALARSYRRRPRAPELRFISGYHDWPPYIEALAASVRHHWARHGEPVRLLMSFHGIPERYAALGDPYPDQCRQTAELLARRLSLEPGRWSLAYQSRFGRAKWLQPSTEDVLARWAGEGTETVDVICPGFPADCLETIDEIGREARHLFESAGGRRLRYIPALNASPEHVEALLALVLRKGSDWWAEGRHERQRTPSPRQGDDSRAGPGPGRRAGEPTGEGTGSA